MKLVIRNSKLFAYHTDDIDMKNLYAGMEVVIVSQATFNSLDFSVDKDTKARNIPSDPRTDGKYTFDDVRYDRDMRLGSCDWTQTLDAPLDTTAKASWATYRQSLRDLTSDFPDAASVVWPTKPA